MTVKADRAENTLLRQIEKLEDVSQVEILNPAKIEHARAV
jgi:acetolactate synthase regulatory subunit